MNRDLHDRGGDSHAKTREGEGGIGQKDQSGWIIRVNGRKDGKRGYQRGRQEPLI